METETFVPLMKKSRGFEGLKEKVLDADLCSRCSTCVAFCDRLEMKEDGPLLVKDCTLTTGAIKCGEDGTCYDNCPMIDYSYAKMDEKAFGSARTDKALGFFKKIVAVRSKDRQILERSQDGGAVTALLLNALENKVIDGAVVAVKDKDWKPTAVLVKSKEELLAAAGTKYSTAPSPLVFGRSLPKARKIALVGTGCQIAGARKFKEGTLKTLLGKKKDSENPFDILYIGLFCYENFNHAKYREKIESLFGIKMEDVVRNDITGGKVILHVKDGKEHVQPVKLFDDVVPQSCKLCMDFTASFADISVGSVGSEKGWSTVIVRSDKGMEILNEAEKRGYVEVSEKIDMDGIRKTDSSKDKKRASTKEQRLKEGRRVPNFEV